MSRFTAAVATAAVLAACSSTPQDQASPRVGSKPALELVESVPIETDLDHAEIADAHRVWLEMIGSARRRLDFAHFYASNKTPSRLEDVIVAIEAAAARGVGVRFLAEAKFAETYPATLERVRGAPGAEVRLYRGDQFAGGVLHAKYFIVDDREVFFGSQNFDWRALTHIVELGMRAREPGIVESLVDVFALDWAVAGGEPRPQPAARRAPAAESPIAVPAHSPRGWLPDPKTWDLPQIVTLIDGAKNTIRIQLLTYRKGAVEIDGALRRASARGVSIELMVSDWSKRETNLAELKELVGVPGIDIKLVTIPPARQGFIPFARVIHAKYLVVDRSRFWLGTSNFDSDYFYKSRNVGVVVRDLDLAQAVDDYFARLWTSSYADELDPDGVYIAPRVQ